MPTRTHLHLDDHPDTVALLSALLGHRRDAVELGFEPREHGAWVDWDAPTTGNLSSTEIPLIHIAPGCAILEGAGGAAPRLVEPVITAVAEVVR